MQTEFVVTSQAMRPASSKAECFYCQQAVGERHKADCVLIVKRVRLRMIVEYEVAMPSHWTKEKIEFHRNESRWCADNAIDELTELSKRNGCICQYTQFECIEDTGEPYLDET